MSTADTIGMEGRVPGGRKKSTECDDMSLEDDDNTGFSGGPVPDHVRHASQSLPRFAPDPTKIDTIQDEFTTFSKTQTLDRKRKPRGLKSFGSFMQKMVRHMSQVSLHAPSPKIGKKRSVSLHRTEPPSETSSVSDITPTQFRPSTLKFDKNKIPGVVGLRNHGNTCFMNAVLQCLSHTELLVEYFVTDQYKNDIKRNNKQNAKKYGTKGELTEHLASLLKSLWTCQYTSDISNDFKSIVGKYGSQYRGCAQHDAQEFLMWLLDKVHEDLNIATKKKYRANKSSVGRTDESVAAEALANHTRCNNSFVYDLFQALYRSSLCCPNCRRHSNTFDPFLSVSLPIPQRVKRPVYVTVVYQDAHPKQVRIGLLMGQADTVADLRQTLATDTKIPESQLILTEIYYDGFHRTFHDSQPITDIHDTDNVYAIETPPPLDDANATKTTPATTGLSHASGSASGSCVSGSGATAGSSGAGSQGGGGGGGVRYLTLVVLNKLINGTQGRRFGGPLVMQVPRDHGFLDIQNDILHNMIPVLRDGIIAQKMGVLFKLRVVDGLTGKCYLPHDVDHPLFTGTVDRALSTCVPGGGPEHVKIIVEWDQQTKQCMIANSDEVVEEHTSVRQVGLAHQQPIIGTLDECFQLYTQEEKLGADNAWHCPNCKKRQQGTVKSLSLWSLPDILVIHLKRFKQIGARRTKLNTLITFPVNGLDMSIHISKRNRPGTQQGHKAGTGWSPWRPNRRAPTSKEDFQYDLYAVCNHYGNMQGGHYTACCKNPADNKWYTFDDTKVTEMSSEDVVTRAAYLLFYQRRTMHHSPPPSDPSHWIHKLPNVHCRVPSTSKSHDDLLEDDSVHVSSPDDGFSRTVSIYATLRGPPRARSNTAPPTPSGTFSKSPSTSDSVPSTPEKRDTRDMPPSMPKPILPSNPRLPPSPSHQETPLAGFGQLISRATPDTGEKRRVRSATVPDVHAASTGKDAGSAGDNEQKKKWEVTRTMFLQESCV